MPKFMKWTYPTLIMEESIDNVRDTGIKLLSSQL